MLHFYDLDQLKSAKYHEFNMLYLFLLMIVWIC